MIKNNKGFSLIEILITISLIAILSGVAYVSYQGYDVSISKKDLKTNADAFASSVSICTQASGGWKVKRADGNTIEPCKAEGTTQAEIKTALKTKLQFTCPAEAECKTYTHSGGEEYYCLSIEKEVSGKKLQIITRVSQVSPSDYHIYCGELSGNYIELSDQNCKKSYHTDLSSFSSPCPWK